MTPLSKVWPVVSFAVLMLVASTGRADTIIMSDGGTTFKIDTASSAGMSGWTLNGGPSIMPQQWLWFRSGASFGSQGALQSVDTITPTPAITFDPGSPNFAEMDYQNSTVEADIVLILADGEPAGMSQQIQWTNESASTLYLTMFQYIHFQFSPNSDSLAISGNNAQQSGANGSSEVGVTPFSGNAGYVGFQAGNASAILSALTTPATSATFNVNNVGSAGGDVAALFEWQAALAPGGSYSISLNESAIATPEPNAALLLGVVLILGSRLLRRSSES